jgi:WD40 repeat protein
MRLFALFLVLFSVTAFAEDDGCTQLQPNSWAWIQKDCHLSQPQSLPPAEPPKPNNEVRNTSEIDYSRWVSLYSFPYPNNSSGYYAKFTIKNHIVLPSGSSHLILFDFVCNRIDDYLDYPDYGSVDISTDENFVFAIKREGSRKERGLYLFDTKTRQKKALQLYPRDDVGGLLNIIPDDTGVFLQMRGGYYFINMDSLKVESVDKYNINLTDYYKFNIHPEFFENTIRIWRNDKTILFEHGEHVLSVKVSPKGTHILSATIEAVYLWKIEHLLLSQVKDDITLSVPSNKLISHKLGYGSTRSRNVILGFSPDGKIAVSSSSYESGKTKLWDVETGKLIHTLRSKHRHGRGIISFSPNGRMMLTTDGYTATIWGDPADKHASTHTCSP